VFNNEIRYLTTSKFNIERLFLNFRLVHG